MQSSVAFCPERRPKDDEIFGDARVNNIHGAHRTPRVVKHPFARVNVELNLVGGVSESEVGDNVLNHSGGIVWRGGDRGLREFMQLGRVEDIPPRL